MPQHFPGPGPNQKPSYRFICSLLTIERERPRKTLLFAKNVSPFMYLCLAHFVSSPYPELSLKLAVVQDEEGHPQKLVGGQEAKGLHHMIGQDHAEHP
jgi:hypothetical protein